MLARFGSPSKEPKKQRTKKRKKEINRQKFEDKQKAMQDCNRKTLRRRRGISWSTHDDG